MRFQIGLAACLVPLAVAAPNLEKRGAPTVELEYATVVGSNFFGVDSFKGIPFAQPPVGNLRLKPPQPVTSHLGTVTATGIPRSCPQMIIGSDTGNPFQDLIGDVLNLPLFQTVLNSGEDCLTINVQKPSTATPDSKLPVVFWIFGGGFELGSTALFFDGGELIRTSVRQEQDIIFVAVNYRVGGFGFLPGAEILEDGSANLGLLDQRLGLEWVADNIAKFGGDPSKVTIWGESAGSISVFDQMALYDGDNTYKGQPLFRAAIMNSGSAVPADPVDCPKGQAVYSQVVQEAGCSNATSTLDCLRGVDYSTFLNAANSVPGLLGYNSVSLSYLPRPDGVALKNSPEVIAVNGNIAKVPFIVGDQEDEGTIFALFQFNITTTAELVSYLSDVFFPDLDVDIIQGFVDIYPDDPSAGSPFGTGNLWSLYPQYKRLAAILGDITFTITRRIALHASTAINPDVPSWSYLASYGEAIPALGTFHGSDILAFSGLAPGFPSSSIQSYYISFINTLDPNNGTDGLTEWPQWSKAQELLHFNSFSNDILADDFRSESYDYLLEHAADFRI